MSAETLQGKVMLVTGSTDGIGKETALELARRGATVILHGKDPGRCQRALDEAVRAARNKSPDRLANSCSFNTRRPGAGRKCSRMPLSSRKAPSSAFVSPLPASG